MVDLGLDEWSQRVLWQVCDAGPYHSSVLIAIDLADLGVVRPTDGAYLLIEMTLVDLNEKGYVVYSVDQHRNSPFTRIRATYEGYEAAGFPPPVRVSGPRHADGGRLPVRPGDMTEWRNHTPHAVPVGPCEKMPLRDHITAYWDHAHLHFEALWEIEERPKENTTAYDYEP